MPQTLVQIATAGPSVAGQLDSLDGRQSHSMCVTGCDPVVKLRPSLERRDDTDG